MKRMLMAVLWPSFVAATVAEGLFFSFFDPHDLPLGSAHPPLSALAIYTFGFFGFWFSGALASLLTCHLLGEPDARLDWHDDADFDGEPKSSRR